MIISYLVEECSPKFETPYLSINALVKEERRRIGDGAPGDGVSKMILKKSDIRGHPHMISDFWVGR